MVRVVGAAGVDDLPDAVPSGQRVGKRGSGRLRLLEAKVEGMEPALGKPAVERARRRAPGNGGIIDGGAKPGIACRDIAEGHIRMAGEKLGDRVDDDVGAMLHRAEHRRCGEGIVDHQQRPVRRRQLGDAGDIGNAECRVRNRLDHDHPGVGPDGGFHGGGVGRVGKARLEAEARQVLAKHAKRAPVELVAGKDMVACLQHTKEHRRNRRHARCRDDPALGAFQPVDRGRQHIGVRMPLAGIGIALQRAFILRVQRVRGFRRIDHRREDRRCHRPAGRSRDRAAPCEAGLAVILVV